MVRIAEVKGGKTASESGQATRQGRKLEEMLEFVNTGIRETPEGIQKLMRFKAEPKTYAAAVGQLIQEARKQGNAHGRLSDCLAVDVFYVDLAARKTAKNDISKQFRNPFAQSKYAGSCTSLDFFQQFTPNLAPYSIYPFADDDCTDIMTGAIWIVAYFNARRFIRCLKRRGLRASLPTEEQVRAFQSLTPGEKRRRELDVPITISRTEFGPILKVSVAQLGRLGYEFLHEESFADSVEEQLDSFVSQEAALVFTAFEDEAALWD